MSNMNRPASRFLSESFRTLTAYVPGEQPRNVDGLIKLNTNENPCPPSPGVLKALDEGCINRLSLYPDPCYRELCSIIAVYHGLSRENVCPFNGSDEALGLCFWGLSEKGAAFPDISYGFYKVFADAFSLPYECIPLDDDFNICIDDYAQTCKTVYIANPNAPTGLYLTPDRIEALLRQNPDRLVIVDEAYIDFGGESAAGLIPIYDNLLVIRTMSKSRSLAGARLGYALGCSELISDLNTIRFSFNPYNVNSMTAKAGIASLEEDEYFKSSCNKIIQARGYTAHALEHLGFRVTDSAANFVFAGEHEKLHACMYYKMLLQNNILVRHFTSQRIDNYVRISIGTMEQMERLITVTEQILKDI